MKYRRITYRYTEVTRSSKTDPLSSTWSGGLEMHMARPYWRPPTDVSETDAGYLVRCELAGVEEGDLEIAIYADAIVVSGARACHGCEESRFHEAEVRYGKFRSEVRFPSDVDPNASEARYERGFLDIRLPKARGVVQ